MKHRAQPRTKPFRHFMTALLLAAFALTGCEDGLVGQDAAEQAIFTETPHEGKLRHAHLLQRAGEGGANKVLERYAELVTQTEFVVGLTASGALSMSAVLERYSGQTGITIKRTYDKVFPGFAAHVDLLKVPDFLNQIEFDDDIAWAEPDARLNPSHPNNSGIKANNFQVLPWGVDFIDADLSFTLAGNGNGAVTGVDVFILDTGISSNDLNIASQQCFTCSTGNSTADKVGHGTHVAGIIGASDNENDAVGVAPGVRLHDYKVLDDNGETDLSTVIAAIEQITEMKAANPSTPMVVNISFGGYVGTNDYNALDEAIAASIAQGVVYVIAAGNDGVDAAHVTPAHVDEALTVGAHDESSRFASFSNYGSTIDILAPGTDVVSLYSSVVSSRYTIGRMSGTSMAAPHVAGAAALYLSQNPQASPQQVRDHLTQNACEIITGAPSGTPGKSVYANGACPSASSDSGGSQGGKGRK